MSTYNYKCTECGTAFGVQASIQEKEEQKGEKFLCPKCNSEDITQEFSITSFFKNVFKSDADDTNCCSDKDACDVGCKPDKSAKSKKGCCEPKKGGGSCCG